MDNKIVSSWVRQARYRANKRNIYSELDIAAVQEIISDWNYSCAYCGADAETLDHPFPLSDTAPNVPANVLPSCKKCKSDKKSNDLVWMFTSGNIEQLKYLEILKAMLSRKGADSVKQHVKLVTGIET